jgi:hypothetical protein
VERRTETATSESIESVAIGVMTRSHILIQWQCSQCVIPGVLGHHGCRRIAIGSEWEDMNEPK